MSRPFTSFRAAAEPAVYAKRGEKVDEGEHLFEPRECRSISVQMDSRDGAHRALNRFALTREARSG